MTISHSNGFDLNLTTNALVSEYKTSGTSTIIVIVEPKDDLIFTTNHPFEIIDGIIIAAEVAVGFDTQYC